MLRQGPDQSRLWLWFIGAPHRARGSILASQRCDAESETPWIALQADLLACMTVRSTVPILYTVPYIIWRSRKTRVLSHLHIPWNVEVSVELHTLQLLQLLLPHHTPLQPPHLQPFHCNHSTALLHTNNPLYQYLLSQICTDKSSISSLLSLFQLERLEPHQLLTANKLIHVINC